MARRWTRVPICFPSERCSTRWPLAIATIRGRHIGGDLPLHLGESPALPTKLNSKVPIELERIVNKCLEKDRDLLPYQYASEIRGDLKRLKRDIEGQAAPAGRWRLLGVATLTLLLAASITLWLWPQHPLAQLKQRQLTVNSSENPVGSAAISPDGKYLAYADLSGIHIRHIETGETQNIPQPESLKGNPVDSGRGSVVRRQHSASCNLEFSFSAPRHLDSLIVGWSTT